MMSGGPFSIFRQKNCLKTSQECFLFITFNGTKLDGESLRLNPWGMFERKSPDRCPSQHCQDLYFIISVFLSSAPLEVHYIDSSGRELLTHFLHQGDYIEFCRNESSLLLDGREKVSSFKILAEIVLKVWPNSSLDLTKLRASQCKFHLFFFDGQSESKKEKLVFTLALPASVHRSIETLEGFQRNVNKALELKVTKSSFATIVFPFGAILLPCFFGVS